MSHVTNTVSPVRYPPLYSTLCADTSCDTELIRDTVPIYLQSSRGLSSGEYHSTRQIFQWWKHNIDIVQDTLYNWQT